MIHEMSIADVRKNFGDLLNEVKYRHDSVLIKKAGKPIAALIEIELFDKIKRLQAEFNTLTMQAQQISINEPEDSIMAEIDEAITATRS